jgi:hypothetical protein
MESPAKKGRRAAGSRRRPAQPGQARPTQLSLSPSRHRLVCGGPARPGGPARTGLVRPGQARPGPARPGPARCPIALCVNSATSKDVMAWDLMSCQLPNLENT